MAVKHIVKQYGELYEVYRENRTEDDNGYKSIGYTKAGEVYLLPKKPTENWTIKKDSGVLYKVKPIRFVSTKDTIIQVKDKLKRGIQEYIVNDIARLKRYAIITCGGE